MQSYESKMRSLQRRALITFARILRDEKWRLKNLKGVDKKKGEAEVEYWEKEIEEAKERLNKPLDCRFKTKPYRSYSSVLSAERKKREAKASADREERDRAEEEEFQAQRRQAVERGEEPPPRRARKRGNRGISALELAARL